MTNSSHNHKYNVGLYLKFYKTMLINKPYDYDDWLILSIIVKSPMLYDPIYASWNVRNGVWSKLGVFYFYVWYDIYNSNTRKTTISLILKLSKLFMRSTYWGFWHEYFTIAPPLCYNTGNETQVLPQSMPRRTLVCLLIGKIEEGFKWINRNSSDSVLGVSISDFYPLHAWWFQ